MLCGGLSSVVTPMGSCSRASAEPAGIAPGHTRFHRCTLLRQPQLLGSPLSVLCLCALCPFPWTVSLHPVYVTVTLHCRDPSLHRLFCQPLGHTCSALS